MESGNEHLPMLLIVLTNELLKKTKLITILSPFHGKSNNNPPNIHAYYLNDGFKTKNAILAGALNKDQIKYVLLTQEAKDGNGANGDGHSVQIWTSIERTKQTKLKSDCSIYYLDVDYNSKRQSINGYLISPNDNDNDDSGDIK